MIEYLDNESRQEIIRLIYDDYISKASKNVMYGLIDYNTVLKWEEYRFNWINDHILQPLMTIKEDNK